MIAAMSLMFGGTALAAASKCFGYPTEASWVNSLYATCVRQHESGNGTTSQNIYEIEGPLATRYYGDYEWLYGVPRAVQNLKAYQLWCKSYMSPWTPYDHCQLNGTTY